MPQFLTLFAPETVEERRVANVRRKDGRVASYDFKTPARPVLVAASCNKLTFTRCVLGANFGARVQALDASKGRDNAAVQSSVTAIYPSKVVCP